MIYVKLEVGHSVCLIFQNLCVADKNTNSIDRILETFFM